jgi:hypothetical protein
MGPVNMTQEQFDRLIQAMIQNTIHMLELLNSQGGLCQDWSRKGYRCKFITEIGNRSNDDLEGKYVWGGLDSCSGSGYQGN